LGRGLFNPSSPIPAFTTKKAGPQIFGNRGGYKSSVVVALKSVDLEMPGSTRRGNIFSDILGPKWWLGRPEGTARMSLAITTV